MTRWRMMLMITCLVTLVTSHDTLVLSSQLKGTTHSRKVESITVMSPEYYRDVQLSQTVNILPRNPGAFFTLKVDYLDIPMTEPCGDILRMCVLVTVTQYVHLCQNPWVESCGKVGHQFTVGFIETLKKTRVTGSSNHGIRIMWVTKQPTGLHRGFRFNITSTIDTGVTTVPVPAKCSGSQSGLKLCLSGWNKELLTILIPFALILIGALIVTVAVVVRRKCFTHRRSGPDSVTERYRHRNVAASNEQNTALTPTAPPFVTSSEGLFPSLFMQPPPYVLNDPAESPPPYEEVMYEVPCRVATNRLSLWDSTEDEND